MNDGAPPTPLPRPPAEYDAQEIDFMFRALNKMLDALVAEGRVRTNYLNVKNIPQGTTGSPPTVDVRGRPLATGDVWWNTTDDSLRVIP
jgi:hypothetical protein